MPSTKTKYSATDPMVDVAWICDYLKVSESTVRRLWRDGDLPVVRVGKKSVRTPRSAVLAYAAANETVGGAA